MKGPLSMRKITEILRLHASGLKQRQIARSLNISIGVVHKYLALAQAAGISWPLEADMDDKQLKAHLFQKGQTCKPESYVPPDCEWIHKELKHKGVTLKLLHEEYKLLYPQAHYQYTQFCFIYQSWKKKQRLSLRQVHKAGESLFVDYAGPTIPITDIKTGEVFQACIFVAVLGASNYTYAEATRDQSLYSWIGSHVRAFDYFGGVPELLVPDNLKAGVSKAHPYDPDLNPSYTDMAAYYGTAILPARPYRPKDKPKVENAVLVVERWILARLRHQQFTSLDALNQAIWALLEELNHKPFQKLPGTRYSQFKELEQSALKPLPAKPYEYATFKRQLVNVDYHVEVDKHYYSVPYAYVKEVVDIRITAHTLEILKDGQPLPVMCVILGRGSQLYPPICQRPTATTISGHQRAACSGHKVWEKPVML
jgi:transposase